MKRLFAILLALLLCVLCACTTPSANGGETGKPAEQETPAQDIAPTEAPETQGGTEEPSGSAEPAKAADNGPGEDYKSAFAFYKGKLIPALTACVLRDHSAAKQALEQREPGIADEDASFNDPIMPFYSAEMDFTADFTDGMDEAFVIETYGEFGYENIEYTGAPGSYTVRYCDELDDGSISDYEDHCEYSAGSIRFSAETNGSVIDFYEFRSLGGGAYALQSSKSRAFVIFIGGEIREYAYSETISELDWDTNKPTAASWAHDPDADSIWNRADLSAEWVTETGDSPLHRVLILNENGELTYYGCKQFGYGGDAVFEPFEPVTIRSF